MIKKPRFRIADKLARYIAPEYQQDNRRAKPPSFMEDHAATRDGLSVNSTEIHTENQIAAIFEKKFNDPRPIGISSPTIQDYNEAASSAGTMVRWLIETETWEHASTTGGETSYQNNPKDGNESHCLVRYTRHFDDLADLRFARRMAYKPTFKLI